jgi:hypothetical protein
MVTIYFKKCGEQLLDELLDITYYNYDKKLGFLHREKMN